MAGQPFGTSAGRPEGVAYRKLSEEYRRHAGVAVQPIVDGGKT
jgi:hypothetical protein